MIIKKVTLKNIKSYSDDVIEFGEGITSIHGQNGAGKSTILESIGYVLFDSLPYKQDEFVRKEAKTGEISITIIGKDNIEYNITRKCGSSSTYTLQDQNGIYIETKELVGPKLCDILGYKVSDITQLKSLFENAIGVLQGTFVSEFLENAGKRKAIFSPLLHVDEYDIAFKNLLVLKNMIDKSIVNMNEEIKYLEGSISRINGLREDKKRIEDEKAGLLSEVTCKKNDLLQSKIKKEEMDKLEKEIRELDAQVKIIDANIKNKQREIENAKVELLKSEAADNKIKSAEPKYILYLAKHDEKKSIEGKREEYREVLISLKSLEPKIDADRNRLEDYKKQLKDLDQLEKDIETLKPMAAEEEQLLKKKEDIVSRLKMKEAETTQLNERMIVVKKSKGNICPLLMNTECKSVTDFSAYFSEHRLKLETEKSTIEKDRLEIIKKINALGEPSKRIAVILEALTKRDRLLVDIKNVESINKNNNAEQMRILLSLKQYEGIDNKYKTIVKDIDELRPYYEEYQQNIKLAKLVEDMKIILQNNFRSFEELTVKFSSATQAFQDKQKSYDKEIHSKIIDEFNRTIAAVAGIEATIKSHENRLSDIDRDIAEINKSIKKIDQQKALRDKEIGYLEFVELTREIIRKAAPEIIRVYIELISKEATEMYCDIAGDRRFEIKWTQDYDIILIEDGLERSFRQLSGGEQMSAALAVRLAVLKILTSSDVVFLDEPTQNLDESRREHLAQEIMRIKDFRQMVIISHDDTFNASLENVIEIEKLNGESKVRRRPGYARP